MHHFHQDRRYGRFISDKESMICADRWTLKYRKLLSCDGNNIHPCCSCKFFVSQKDMNLIEI